MELELELELVPDGSSSEDAAVRVRVRVRMICQFSAVCEIILSQSHHSPFTIISNSWCSA